MTRPSYRRGRRRRLFGLLVITLAFTAAIQDYAVAATQEEYEKRIAALEKRIERLEAMVDGLSAERKVAPANRSGRLSAQEAESRGREESATATSTSTTPDAEPEAEIAAEDQNALQQLYVIRDAAVTLSPGRWQTDFEFTYTRDSGFLQSSWALGATASVRHGAGGGWEFGVHVPYDWTHRHTATATPRGLDVDLAAFGDVSFDVSKLVLHETPTLPGIVVSGGLTIPTGVYPYGPGALTPGKDPSDPFAFYRNAGGHYTAEIGAELFKTVDPFAYFAGVRFSYPFAREVGGEEVFPGYLIAYNLGATLALSESTSLGFAVLGAVKTDMITGGKKVPGSSTLPLSTSISILQRIAEGFYIEPSITIGLTDDAPDAVLALKTTKTF
jgi:uncharacterized small protein (DUF1192 family)